MNRPGPYKEYLLFVGVVVALAAALCLVGLWPTRKLGGATAVTAMPIAVGIAALGSIVGGLPILFARARGAVKPYVALVSMMVRLFVVAAVAAVTLLSASLPLTPFLLWLAGGYMALLVVDTGYAMRLSSCL